MTVVDARGLAGRQGVSLLPYERSDEAQYPMGRYFGPLGKYPTLDTTTLPLLGVPNFVVGRNHILSKQIKLGALKKGV